MGMWAWNVDFTPSPAHSDALWGFDDASSPEIHLSFVAPGNQGAACCLERCGFCSRRMLLRLFTCIVRARPFDACICFLPMCQLDVPHAQDGLSVGVVASCLLLHEQALV